jgi:lysophospholipase L1-like esterase
MRLLTLAATLLLTVALLQSVSYAAEMQGGASPPAGTAASAAGGGTARVTAPGGVPPGDELVTGTGDTSGWHIFAAAAGDGWRWHALATLRPAAYEDERWIGQQCLTGDGRYVIAVAAPWHANNSGGGVDHGGFAYAIDAHNGNVRPLASGVSLAYFNPGCGAGHQVALTSYLTQDEGATRVAVVDAATGTLVQSVAVHGELTSAVPVGSAIAAARGSALVWLTGGRESVMARGGGQVFDVRANNSGGADFLVAQGRTAAVWQLAGASAHEVTSGPLTQVQLLAGRDGKNLVTGTGPVTAAGLIQVAAPANSHLIAASLDGQETASRPAGRRQPSQQGPLTLAPSGSSQTVTASLPQPVTRAATALPGLNLGAPASGQQSAALVPSRGMAVAANTATPACAVPRNDLWTQVPQPNSAQIQWAVQQAVRGWLVPGNIPARPANPENYKIGDSQPLPQFYPNQDFPPPAIAGWPGAVVPQVMYGIMAQESNWNQASWHALAGYGGNPLVANYYGSSDPANPADVNFANADCGYGIAQITDLMRTGAANINTQTAIAVDYAENIAAAVTALVGKWNQLHSIGVTMNNDDPSDIENWYGAIWAYNSGVHLVANGDPANGLGWFNNPANPIYPVNRHPFLCADSSCTSYTDANTPQDWPYQEKVLGWIEGGQFDPNNPTAFRFTPLGSVLDIPPASTFCNPGVNICDPSLIGTSDPCPDESSSCWWGQSAQWANCANQCTAGSFTITSPIEPEPAPTTRPEVCDEINSPTDLPGNALIVADTALASQNPQDLSPNVVGCPDAGTRNWHDSGSFDLKDSAGLELSPSDVASIDLHQIGAGFGGHAWFTHTRPSSDAAHAVIGQWTLDNTGGGIYEIRVFVPTPGATTTTANYTVDGLYHRTLNQNNYNNQWVSIGFYPLHAQATVTLTGITGSGDPSLGADVAFGAVAFIPVESGSYVALGDSYSAGEGTGGPWDEGTDVQTANGAQATDLCHRSPDAYGPKYAQLTQTFIGSTVIHLACSGGTLTDLDNIHWIRTPDGTTYFDPSHPYQWPTAPSICSASPSPCTYSGSGGTASVEPGSQVSLLQQIPSPKLVTLTIGGNDAGFAGIITNCVYQFLGINIKRNGTCQSVVYTNPNGTNQLDKTIATLQAPITKALQDVKAAVPVSTKIVLLTYPAIFNSNSGQCSLLYSSDVQWLMTEAQKFDQMLMNAAASAGVSVLNEENAFQGHELCTGTPWVQKPDNPIQPDLSLKDNYFHPLAAGYAREAQDLKNYLSSIP